MTTLALRYANRAARMIVSPEAAEPAAMISFGSGHAYPEGFPDLSEMALNAAKGFRTETLQYAPRAGLPQLREWIAEHLRRAGIHVAGESVLLVNGAKQGLDLVCKLFVDPGDAVVVTRPNYQAALGILRGWEVEFLEVGLDEEGLDVVELKGRLDERGRAGRPAPKLVYVVPEFHNPTGVTMSRRRREGLLDLAARFGFIIVEDDPYRHIRFEGTPVAPIQALGGGSHVIGLGTFSKLLAPGLRVGWVTATPDVIARMAALKADGGSCPFTQRMILEYARAERIEPHLRDLVSTYAGHRDVMVTALGREIPDARFTVPSGGYYLWLRLSEALDTDALLSVATRHGVEFLPGSHFYATPGPKSDLRLAYSHASPSEILVGVSRLREAITELRSRQTAEL